MKADLHNLDWDVCGHEKASYFLQSAIRNEMLSHAYLFCGPCGVGKYRLAMEFAKTVMCGSNGDKPCGNCFSCKQMNQGSHLDLFVVERLPDDKKGKLKKDIAIDQIRDLKSKLQQGTLLNSYKVAIIPEAQHLNGSATSALLKILEESAPRNIIILITDDISRMPRTIVSRCQKIKFNSVSSFTIEKYLIQKHGVSLEEAKMLARVACGRPGKALGLVANNERRKEYFSQIDLFFKLLGTDLNSRFTLINNEIVLESDESQNRFKVDYLLDNWQSLVRDILLFQSGSRELISNINNINHIERTGSIISSEKLMHLLNSMSQAKQYFNQNINPKLVLENLIIKL